MGRRKMMDKYRILLDAVFCVSAADGSMANSELAAIARVFEQIQAPFSKDTIVHEAEAFAARVRTTSLRQVLDETKVGLTRHATSVSNRRAYREALRLVANADGEVARKEQYVMDEFRKAIEANDAPDYDISDLLDEAEQVRGQPTSPVLGPTPEGYLASLENTEKCEVCGHRFRLWLTRRRYARDYTNDYPRDNHSWRDDTYTEYEVCPACDAPRPGVPGRSWSEWWSDFMRFG